MGSSRSVKVWLSLYSNQPWDKKQDMGGNFWASEIGIVMRFLMSVVFYFPHALSASIFSDTP
jgi:hypothetical protein